MNKKLGIGIVAIVAIVAVAMFAGCIEEEEAPEATPTPTLTPTSYNDSKYFEWAMDTTENILSDITLLANAGKSGDFEGVEMYSRMLYDDAKKALDEIDQFDVSPKMQPSKREFKLALQDFKQGGYYGEKGARNYDADEVNTASEYVLSGTTHLERSIDLWPEELRIRNKEEDEKETEAIIAVTPAPSPTVTSLSEPKYEAGDIIMAPSIDNTLLYVWNRTNGNYTLSVISMLPFMDEKYIISKATEEFPIQNVDRVTYRVGTLEELEDSEEVPTKFVMGKYIHVKCSGEWSGSYGSYETSIQSIDGEGNSFIPLFDDPLSVTVVFQNEEKYGCLEVEIIHNGKVVKSAYTCADYGVVSLSYTF